ncbi:MAG: ribonuclease BN [Pseudopedobacter saltans]|uniref:Ribonuclease BN n=1 Tax=Pseudopedobacter saltans TaxID=151895 RepID=A0A2W5F0K7_9SPHI|nr:MAG: ribonuclease BN [Pseudopedobacter saltans]
MKKVKFFFGTFWAAINDFIDLKVPKMSAALSYYTIFAMAPMLIIIIKVSSFFAIGKPQDTIFHEISEFVGPDVAKQIQSMIENAAISPSASIAYIVSICALVFSATGVFAEIQDSINVIWQLKPKPKKGWLKLILNRLLGFSVLISLGFILLVSLVVSSVLDALAARIIALFPDLNIIVVFAINYGLSFIVTLLLFSIIFKFLPDAKIKLRDVFSGAFATTVLFILGKFAIGYYLQHNKVATMYGAAGSVIILLSWVYYSAMILYFGATFTKVNAMRQDRKIQPNDYAVWVEQVEIKNKEPND